MQTPQPPSITPRQMNLLRIVASMAWADGELATTEVNLMLDRFCSLFAADADREPMQQELRDYIMQNIPLDELIHQLETQAEKELVLQLGYQVIASSSRTPDEPKINAEEAAAYQKLVQLLNLPEDAVKRIEAEASAADDSEGIVEKMAQKLENFIKG
ncbi:TerB family tellurite resistance protein [Tychonema sp. LEGE 07199]|uniref:TerB family tellurite resistance protein n=1 Tax=unclassified Tychonema TaxID=2642144 RepID=UPI00187F17B0|nr:MULTISPECIES: TerB family tellurite resistance protein [unclassified Tychonema]MBE9122083.1 TerB family tellurite resistance protein [Tychonema sp. LEGE 07199]MBE9134052.1 TerB family tellurite resistance protein [Tychonema sp. LEGE 07196]